MSATKSSRSRFTLAIFVVTITSGTVLAQNAWQAGLPETTPCPQSIAAIATCYAAKHETGAYLLAAMPKDWNGDLIVFAHGGPDVAPPTSTRSLPDLDKYSVAVRRGFARVASTYRRSGYGVHMAAQDSDDARKFFIARIAKPKRTILHGASYGGLVGAKLIETFAKNLDGSATTMAPSSTAARSQVPLATTIIAPICALSINITAITYRVPTSRNTRCGTASRPIPR